MSYENMATQAASGYKLDPLWMPLSKPPAGA